MNFSMRFPVYAVFNVYLREPSINANIKNPIATKRQSMNGIQNGQRTQIQDQCATGSIASNFSTRNTMPITVRHPTPLLFTFELLIK